MKPAFSPLLSSLSRGFTLIEVLVVMVLIGIIISMASLSLNPRDESELLKQDIKTLQALLHLAREEAIIKQRLLGLVFDKKGYQFVYWQHTDKTWLALASTQNTKAVWRRRDWQQTWRWDLSVEGETWSSSTIFIEENTQGAHVLLHPDGSISAFDLMAYTSNIDNNAVQYQLKGLGQGQFSLAQKI
jgi:general secretion pathway protein H